MTWGDIIYLGRQWPGSPALYRPASLCCTRGAPCVCPLSSGGPCLHLMFPVCVLCPLEVHVSISCSLWLSSVLWRSMSPLHAPCDCPLSSAGPCPPVCVFCPLQVHVSTWCSELAPSLSQTTNYCLPIFCIFLYISIFSCTFYISLYFSVPSVLPANFLIKTKCIELKTYCHRSCVWWLNTEGAQIYQIFIPFNTWQ